MKRALHLLDTLRFGGAESVALNYARLMAEWGIGSTLCGKPDAADFERFASEYAKIETRFSLRAVRQADYLFIHSNRNLLKIFFIRPFFRKRGKRIIYIQHLPYSECKFRLVARLINWTCTDFIRITPLTEKLAEKYIRILSAFIPNFYIPRHPVSEHGGIRCRLRTEYGIPPDQKVILFTGALKPGKGLDDFLSLAGRFTGDDRYRFVVVGDGEESAKAGTYPHGNLLRVGWQADVERWLIASDAYCFCSRREMMPMALIEAQAIGLSVLALSSKVGDFLLDGQTFRDIDAVEEALRTGRIPMAASSRYGREYAENVLKKILRKKILHIQVLPKLTGVQRVSLEIFRSLPEDEYDKTILFGGPENPHTAYCSEQFKNTGAKVLLSKHLQREIGLRDWRAFREIYRLCRRERFDIVHTHSTKPGIVGRLAARLAGAPWVVHTVHGVAFHRYISPLKRLYYYAAEFPASFFSHRITLVSGYYRKYYRVFRRKTEIVYNGIRISGNLPVVATQSGKGIIRLLFVGRLEEAKDPLTLLRAFVRIVHGENRKNIRLTLVGDGSLEEDCRRFIVRNGLSDYVALTGWVAEPAGFYTDHQIFCLSSIHESFGICLLEAGIHALPVVATRVGGVPEVIEEGVTGLLVPPRDPEAMAQAILRLADAPEWREQIGKAARRRVMDRFAAERMTIAYKRIYDQEL